MSNTYLIGQVIRLTCVFYTIAGAATDPTTVTLSIRAPDGTISTPLPTKDSVGNYHYDLTPVQAGFYHYRWAGTGALVAAAEEYFMMTASRVI